MSLASSCVEHVHELTLLELPGNRSSVDDSRDAATDDETVVDPEQGNGT